MKNFIDKIFFYLKSKSENIKKKEKRIASCDYEKWDKYDVDTEVNRIDLQQEREKAQAKMFQQKMKNHQEAFKKENVVKKCKF